MKRTKIFVSDIEYAIRNGMTYIPIRKDSVSDAIITVRFLSMTKDGIHIYVPVIDDIHSKGEIVLLREWNMSSLVDFINELLEKRSKGLLLNYLEEKVIDIVDEYM